MSARVHCSQHSGHGSDRNVWIKTAIYKKMLALLDSVGV